MKRKMLCQNPNFNQNVTQFTLTDNPLDKKIIFSILAVTKILRELNSEKEKNTG